jgi:hypothetical protein
VGSCARRGAVTCRACWFSRRVWSRSRCDQVDPRAPSPWRWRTHGLIRAMTQVVRGNRDCDQTVHDFLVSGHAAVRRILDVEVVLEPARPARCDATRRAADRCVSALRFRGQRPRRLVVGRPVQDAVEAMFKAVLECEPLLDLAGDWGCPLLARNGRSGARAHSVSGGIAHGRLGDAVVAGGRQLQLADGAGQFHRLRSTGNLRGGQSFKAVPHTAAAQW